MPNQLKKVRNRNEAQEFMLSSVQMYRLIVKASTQNQLQVSAMFRRGMIDEKQHKEFNKEVSKPWKQRGASVIKLLEKMCRGVPVWEGWLQHVRGVGPALGTQVIAIVQPIADFDTPSKLWAYAGYHCDADGNAVKRVRGQQSNWNDDLKTIVHQIAESMVKQRSPYYEKLYLPYRERDKAQHPEPIAKLDAKGNPMKDKAGKPMMLYRDGHLHARALRYVKKIFLAHLWQAWRELEGLPTRTPYPMEKLGHTTVISPWEFVELPQAEENENPKPPTKATA